MGAVAWLLVEGIPSSLAALMETKIGNACFHGMTPGFRARETAGILTAHLLRHRKKVTEGRKFPTFHGLWPTRDFPPPPRFIRHWIPFQANPPVRRWFIESSKCPTLFNPIIP
jgi:hypothetical protein